MIEATKKTWKAAASWTADRYAAADAADGDRARVTLRRSGGSRLYLVTIWRSIMPCARMKDFQVRVGHRVPRRASRKTLEDLKKKRQVDVVIGTHRVLSKDVGFKNLGLLIIDEEQRFSFGVAHGKKIKKLKEM